MSQGKFFCLANVIYIPFYRHYLLINSHLFTIHQYVAGAMVNSYSSFPRSLRLAPVYPVLMGMIYDNSRQSSQQPPFPKSLFSNDSYSMWLFLNDPPVITSWFPQIWLYPQSSIGIFHSKPTRFSLNQDPNSHHPHIFFFGIFQ